MAYSDTVGTELELVTSVVCSELREWIRNIRFSDIRLLEWLTNEGEGVEIEGEDSEFWAEEIAARAIRPKASQVAFRAQSLFLISIS